MLRGKGREVRVAGAGGEGISSKDKDIPPA
jgi:hypothetical protein